MLPSDHEIIALANQRNEVEAEYMRHSPCSDAAIHRAGLYLPGGGEMAGRQMVVAANFPCVDMSSLQARIEQRAATRSFFAVDDSNIRPRKILNPMDALRVAARSQD